MFIATEAQLIIVCHAGGYFVFLHDNFSFVFLKIVNSVEVDIL